LSLFIWLKIGNNFFNDRHPELWVHDKKVKRKTR